MDQIRTIVRVIWRERFWVLSVLGIIVAIVCWHLSASDLDQQFAKRQSEIKSSFESMERLSQQPVHPNDDVNRGDKLQASQQREIVLTVWQELYDRQREEVLQWPIDSLKPEFIEEIEKLKFRDPFPARKAKNMRLEYQNYIGKRFDGLLEIVKARKSAERGGRSRFGGSAQGDLDGGYGTFTSADEKDDQDYLVLWLDQANLQGKLQFASEPTDLQIWVTQEDLWVYETLLSVIAATNEKCGATRPDNTAVRAIVAMEVGREAAAASRTSANLVMPSSAGTGGMVGGEAYGEGGYGEGGYGEGGYGEGGLGEGGYGEGGFGEGGFGESRYGMRGGPITNEQILANRYLDAEGLPYPSDPEDAEYRRLPVRLQLRMDQRWLPNLLVECANAALPVEVDQVRVNADKSGGSFGGRAGRGGGLRSRNVRGLGDLGEDPTLADVEIRGVVYIYNEPDESVLAVPGLDEDQFADATDSLQR